MQNAEAGLSSQPVDSVKPGLAAVMARELSALRTDRWALALISWWPLLLLGVIWWTLAAGLPRGLPVVWIDHDRSASSRQFLRLLAASPTLDMSTQVSDEIAAMSLLRQGKAVGWLVVPRDFEREIKAGHSPRVHLQVNGQQATGAGMVKSQVQTIVTVFSAGVELKIRNAHGEPLALAAGNLEPLRPGLLTLFNPTMNYEAFLVPALGSALLQLIAMFIGVASVGRELRFGSVPQWLASANEYPFTALAGKLMVELAPLVLLTCVMIFGLAWGRGHPVQGSLPLLLLAHLLALIASATLGAVVVMGVRSLRLGLSVAGLLASPAFTYAGAGYPLMAMPLAAQAWAATLPLTHLLNLQAGQWGMAATLASATQDLAVLFAMAALPWLLVPWLLARCAQPSAWGRP
jgi:ABC-2 type transport system permease protein